MADLGAELAAREADVVELEREIGRLETEVSEMDSEVAKLDAEVLKLRRALEGSEAKERRTASEYGARVRELEQLVSTLAAGLAQTRDDIDRAAGSRAWRWGHGATRALRTLSPAPQRHRGSAGAAP